MKKTNKKVKKVVKKKTLVRYALFETKKGKTDNFIWVMKKTNDPTIKEFIDEPTAFGMPCRAADVPVGTQFKWELTIKNYNKPEVKEMEKKMKKEINTAKADYQNIPRNDNWGN
jgi:hypothetical protein